MNSLDIHEALKQDDKCSVYEGVHIPGCYGCAIYGHDRCTCTGKVTSKGEGAQPPEPPPPNPCEYLRGPQPPVLPPFTVVPE